MPPRPIGLLSSTAVISPRPGKCALAVVVAVLVSLLCNRGAKQALKSMLLPLCFVSYVSMHPLIPCLSPSPYQISIKLLLILLTEETCSFTARRYPANHRPRYRAITTLSSGRKTMEERHLITKTTAENRTSCLVDFKNFWRKTEANFTACERPDRPPCFKS